MVIMADGHDNSAANTPDIPGEPPSISALQQQDITSDSLVEHLKVNKSKFCWDGTFSELKEFTNKHLHLGDGVAKVIDNENKKTIKSDHLTLNWYESTGTLQVQGSNSSSCRTFLNQLIDGIKGIKFPAPCLPDTSDEDGAIAACHQIWSDLPSAGPESVDIVTKSMFAQELDKIWSEIKILNAKFSSDSDKIDKQEDNIQIINSLKQKNQDLNNEICILKTRLNQEIDVAKKLTEERDSLKTALQIVTKDLMNLSDDRPIFRSEQLSDEYRSQSKNVSSGEKIKKQKQKHRDPPQHVTHRNRFEPLSHEDSEKDITPPSDADKTFTTVLVGDSIIKQIQGQQLGRKVGHRVVVKSFPGASTNDMKHYLMPTFDKSPQQIILHVGTNDLRDHSPTVVAENIVDLARQIEMESNTEVILSELVSRSDNVPNDAVKAVNKRLSKYCNQNDWRMIKHQNIDRNCLNRGGLHLNEKGNNILFRNFVNALDNSSTH